MKLQKRLSRIYNGKKYYKWIITLPEDDVNYAEFKEGDKIEVDSEKGKIFLMKKE